MRQQNFYLNLSSGVRRCLFPPIKNREDGGALGDNVKILFMVWRSAIGLSTWLIMRRSTTCLSSLVLSNGSARNSVNTESASVMASSGSILSFAKSLLIASSALIALLNASAFGSLYGSIISEYPQREHTFFIKYVLLSASVLTDSISIRWLEKKHNNLFKYFIPLSYHKSILRGGVF